MSDDTAAQVTELMIVGILARNGESHDRCLSQAVELLEAAPDVHDATIDTLVNMARYAAFTTAMLSCTYRMVQTDVVDMIQEVITRGVDTDHA